MRVIHVFLLISIAPILACNCQSSASVNCSHAACGSFHNITYPFGLSNSGCGHPDFQIQCLNSHPLFTINNQMYRILEHRPTSIVIANNRLFADCGIPDASVDLTGTPFSLIRSSLFNLTLLSGCIIPLLSSVLWYPVVCNSSWQYTWAPLLQYTLTPLYRDCEYVVQVPKPEDRANVTDILQFLQRGFEIEWNGNDPLFENCTACTSTNGMCGYNISDSRLPFLCYHPDNPDSPDPSDYKGDPARKRGIGETSAGILAGVCVGGVVAMAAAITVIVRQCRRADSPPKPSSRGRDFRVDNSRGTELVLSSKSVVVPLFSYEELEEATNFFDEKREIGDGGFGSVYLGTLGDGRPVAVKRMYQENSRRVEQFGNEVQILSSLSHPNLIRLLGYCQERRELLLVFEYVPNGTLADHLHGDRKEKRLSWETRLNIAVQVARALEYLHFCVKPPIFHRDVKSSNILLEDNFSAKVADFGLSRFVPSGASHVSTAPQGTPGYLDPDYHQWHRLTDKSDVYSFGVVLAEIISAKKAVDARRNSAEIRLANLAISKIQSGSLHELVDADLEMESNPLVKAMVHGVAELAFRCLASDRDDRPNMIEVVAELRRINEIGYGRTQNRLINSQNSFELVNQETYRLISDDQTHSPTSVVWLCTSTTPDACA